MLDVDPIENWLAWKGVNENRAATTLSRYRLWLTRCQTWLGTPIAQATYQQLESWSGLHLYKSGVSPGTRKIAVAAIKGLFGWLQTTGVIATDPTAQLPYPKIGSKMPVAMGLHNAEKMLMQPDLTTFLGLRDAAILAMLIGTGMRVSGLCSLNESNLLLYKIGTVTRMGLRVTEKGDKERIIPVPSDAQLLCQAYLGHEALDAIDRTLPAGDRVLFVTTGNRCVKTWDYVGEARRIRRGAVQDLLKKYAALADIPASEAHPHALRHLLGAELAEDSINPLEISNILGHASVETSKIYTRLAIRKLTSIIDTSNPLAKMQTPVSALIKELKRIGQI